MTDSPTGSLRLALVHDWLTGMRGGEKCLEALCRLWPEAHLYTLIYRPGKLSPPIERMVIRTSFLQRVPGIEHGYRHFLPLMPAAVRRWRLADYDVVVSLSHCVAKSVPVAAGVPHLCYCFTPMRYAWHMREQYLERQPAWLRPVQRLVLAALRGWDRRTAAAVTQFIAISRTVQQRIHDCYGRDSVVVYPPADVELYRPAAGVQREPFYLCVSALVPYKRIELAIEACRRLGRPLVVIGSGPEQERLRRQAGPAVQFLGWQPDAVIRDYYCRCRALLFPGEEDFGIVPVEAQACGAPVIAYAAGGATETVVPPAGTARPGTGLLFAPQSAQALAEAMTRLERQPQLVDPRAARRQAEQFATARFARQMAARIAAVAGTPGTQRRSGCRPRR